MTSFHRILFVVGVVVSLLVGVSTVSAEKRTGGLRNPEPWKEVVDLNTWFNSYDIAATLFKELNGEEPVTFLKQNLKEQSMMSKLHELFNLPELMAVFLELSTDGDMLAIVEELESSELSAVEMLNISTTAFKSFQHTLFDRDSKRIFISVVKKALPMVKTGEIFHSEQFANLVNKALEPVASILPGLSSPHVKQILHKLFNGLKAAADGREVKHLPQTVKMVKRQLILLSQ